MSGSFVLEACVDSLASALAAREGGATRLELCANLIIGGTTPMPSLVEAVKRETGLPVHALLRPRFGDFLYDSQEHRMLFQDACALLDAGADAVVSGFLTRDGDLDLEHLTPLVELCHSRGRRFTLHRAFDVCRDPLTAWEQCQVLGVNTVLTSGQGNTCLEGLPLLKELWQRRGEVELLIGAGVDAAAIREIRRELPQANAFHMSGKAVLESPMTYRKEGVSMGLPGFDEYTLWRTDPQRIRAARKELMNS
ncbi:MAG: copper homeostasis protein CutC [Acutalibacter sp.]|jgi:copper homeostasis protein